MRFVQPKNAVLLHLLFLLAFLTTGYAQHLNLATHLPVIWLGLAVFEALLLFPTARRGERIKDSRRRAWRRISRDPFFHIGIAFLIVVVVQTLNGPASFVYSGGVEGWQIKAPPLRGLPFSLVAKEAFEPFFRIFPVWIVVLAVRHGLTRRTKLALLRFMLIVAAVAGVVSLIAYAASWGYLWDKNLTLSGYGFFADKSVGGIFFGLMFLVSGGCLLEASISNDKVAWQRTLLVSTIILFLAASFSLSGGALLMAWGLGFAWLLYAVLLVWINCKPVKRIELYTIFALIVGLLAFLHLAAYPENALHGQIESIKSGDAFKREWPQENKLLRKAAFKNFSNNILYGTSADSFAHVAGIYLDDDDWSQVSPERQEPSNCSNTPLTYLSEYGLVGGGLLFALLIFTLWPLALKLWQFFKQPPARSDGTKADGFWQFSPIVASSLLGLLGVLVLQFFTVSGLNPLIMASSFMLLGCLPAFIGVKRGK